MANSIYKKTEEKIKYSKLLSSLFCSTSMIILAILSLLNNLTLDLYSAYILLKVVIPASFCFWFIGLIIGSILDKNNKKILEEKRDNEKKAYEIPSMFLSETDSLNDSEFKDLL